MGDKAQNRQDGFVGFLPPTSNTTYTPNQFFDVLIPSARKTGVIRVVGFIVRQQLGWCDADGNPRNPSVRVSYLQLEKRGGVGHTQMREALNEAVEGRFIRCLKEGRPSLPGQSGQSAQYEIRWNEVDGYTTAPSNFRGFFAREGNRTFIPNQFFDHILPNESLAIIKVVAAIIRNTIGWRNRFGFQRRQVQLSVTDLERKTKLSRRALRLALNLACEKNFIERIDRGFFDPCGGRKSQAAVYGLKWLDHWRGPDDLIDAAPECTTSREPSFAPAETPDHSRLNHGSTPEKTTDKRSRIYHDKKRKNKNNISEKKTTTDRATKPEGESVVVDGFDVSFELLLERGFSKRDAARLAELQPPEVIRNQVEWLSQRKPQKNPLGLLRRAIEENWSNPNLEELRTSGVPEKADRLKETREKRGRELHEQKHHRSYLEYLRAKEEQFGKDHPDRYREFQDSLESTLRNLSKPGFYEPSQAVLARFRSEDSRLKSFADFFGSKARDPQKKLVLDFWEWDNRHNPHSFRGRGENP